MNSIDHVMIADIFMSSWMLSWPLSTASWSLSRLIKSFEKKNTIHTSSVQCHNTMVIQLLCRIHYNSSSLLLSCFLRKIWSTIHQAVFLKHGQLYFSPIELGCETDCCAPLMRASSRSTSLWDISPPWGHRILNYPQGTYAKLSAIVLSPPDFILCSIVELVKPDWMWKVFMTFWKDGVFHVQHF